MQTICRKKNQFLVEHLQVLILERNNRIYLFYYLSFQLKMGKKCDFSSFANLVGFSRWIWV